ncbi:MAG: carbohydrate ABC transporter permease [Anaerolineae bacterium]|nr:carbohydrate ABC transporter permease [Anaerolineae bacterium]
MASTTIQQTNKTRFQCWYADLQRSFSIGLGIYIFRILLLAVIGLIFIIPMLWLVVTPTKERDNFYDYKPLEIGELSYVPIAWQHLFDYNNSIVTTWVLNSVWYVITGLLLVLFITVPAGYVLAVVNFPGRHIVMWITLLLMMLPGDILVLPMFLELHAMGLFNTPWALILPAGFSAAAVYLTFVFYKGAMPRDLIDAARVDGCSNWTMFWNIGLPLAKTIIALLLFTRFGSLWNNFFAANVLIVTDKLRTLPAGIGMLITSAGAVQQYSTAYEQLHIAKAEATLAGIVALAPVLVIFLVAQRMIVRGGATVGSVKG